MYRETEGTDSANNSSSDDDDEDEIWHREHEEERDHFRKNNKRCGWKIIVEWILFVVITTALVCSLTVKSLKDQTKWGLETWKWCLMIMVIFSGRLFSDWVIAIIVFFIERNFLLREKVLYFVHGLRKSFENCIWLALVLLSWSLMFSPDVQKNNEIFKKVFRALIAVLVGATIWLIKTVLVKILASSFHVATFFDRMKESVFHHYILDSLSGPARGEIDQTVPAKRRFSDPQAHSLNDTKTAVEQLHKLASALVSVLIAVVIVLVMGLATSKVILVITSQLLLVGFMFQNTCKIIFESVVFVFVMHPFDVGDRCKIDGVMMIVEEMNILTTVFLKIDMEKVYYPNSVLSTKPISNYYRSPDMLDYVDFMINSSTSSEKINLLKKDIQTFIENKPKHWTPKHALLVKEISTLNKLDMSLLVTHTQNHQNFLERNLRRTELILELKKIFETLGIKYQLLPQQVHLPHVSTANGGPSTQL
ncbi:hypothetical protein MKX03_019874 [Papaver bracteatum]|nr:hypothetical protein MKX03_019874 [Papaver bracteatum]